MSVPEELQKIKGILASHEGKATKTLHVLIIALVGIGGYLLGTGQVPGEAISTPPRASTEASPEPQTQPEIASSQGLSSSTPVAHAGAFVASKKGTKYHRADCPGAQTIKDANRITFATEIDARNAGYLPAGNCPGLMP